MSDDGRSAQRIDPLDSFSGIVLSSVPLRGLCEFEVKLTEYGDHRWFGNLMFGIVCFEKRKLINSSHFPINATEFDNCCVWNQHTISKREIGGTVVKQPYQQDLCYQLRKGNTVGLQITKEGTLSFYLNGSCKGEVMVGVYDKSNMEVYAVVDHYGGAISTEIVRAGEWEYNDVIIIIVE